MLEMNMVNGHINNQKKKKSERDNKISMIIMLYIFLGRFKTFIRKKKKNNLQKVDEESPNSNKENIPKRNSQKSLTSLQLTNSA